MLDFVSKFDSAAGVDVDGLAKHVSILAATCFDIANVWLNVEHDDFKVRAVAYASQPFFPLVYTTHQSM